MPARQSAIAHAPSAESGPHDTREVIPIIVVVFRIHSTRLPIPNAEGERRSAGGHRLHLIHRPHRLVILIIAHATHTAHLITIIRIIPRIIHVLLRSVLGNILYTTQSPVSLASNQTPTHDTRGAVVVLLHTLNLRLIALSVPHHQRRRLAIQRIRRVRVPQQLRQEDLENVHHVVHGRPGLVDDVEADAAGSA